MKVRFVVSRGSVESSREKRRGWRKVSDCLSPYDLDQYQGRSDASYQVKVRVAVLTFHNLEVQLRSQLLLRQMKTFLARFMSAYPSNPAGSELLMTYETMVVQQRQTLSVPWSDFTH